MLNAELKAINFLPFLPLFATYLHRRPRLVLLWMTGEGSNGLILLSWTPDYSRMWHCWNTVYYSLAFCIIILETCYFHSLHLQVYPEDRWKGTVKQITISVSYSIHLWVDFDGGNVRLFINVFNRSIMYVPIMHLHFKLLMSWHRCGGRHDMGVCNNQPGFWNHKSWATWQWYSPAKQWVAMGQKATLLVKYNTAGTNCIIAHQDVRLRN